MSTRARNAVFAIITIAMGFALSAVLLEVVLRFLPVSGGAYTTEVNARQPILHFEPNHTFTAAVGPRLEYANRGRINNAGWVSDQTYDSTARTPLLALIGDSYIEAFIVPYAESVQGHLATAVGPSRRAYAFGLSGWALSQYLAVAEFVGRGYRPDAMVVNIVGNDFDESLLRYKSARGFHYFRDFPDSSLKLERVDYARKWHYWLVRHSALWRYALGHLRLISRLKALGSSFGRTGDAEPQKNDYVGNVPRVVEPERVAWSKRAVDEFLAELPQRSGLAPDRILFVVDGMRPQLYDPVELARSETSYFGQMREYFMSHAREGGFEVLDMQPVFVAAYAAQRKRLEFPHDGHWNGIGHGLVADAVSHSKVFTAFMGTVPPNPAAVPVSRTVRSDTSSGRP